MTSQEGYMKGWIDGLNFGQIDECMKKTCDGCQSLRARPQDLPALQERLDSQARHLRITQDEIPDHLDIRCWLFSG